MKALDREILRLAIPSILANITVPLVGMVDIAVAGHLHSAEGTSAAFIGGISVGALILSVVYWNFAFLRASTGGLTAQAYGRLRIGAEGDLPSTILRRAMALSLGFAALLLVLQWPLSRLALVFNDSTPRVADLAIRYFFVRIWAAPATLSLMSLKGWFIGMQDTLSSMFTDLVVNVVNIAGSIVLTLGAFGWEGIGFDGIALGTVIAQYSGLAFAALVLLIKYRVAARGVAGRCGAEQCLDVISDGTPGAARPSAYASSRERKPESRENDGTDVERKPESRENDGTDVERKPESREDYGAFFRLNADLFVRSLCFTGVYLGYTFLAAKQGETLLACANIMMNLLMLFSYFTDGFAYAGEALVGRFIGEKDPAMTRRSTGAVFAWSMGVAGIWMIIYWLGGAPMMRLMTDDFSVREACLQFLPWLIAMPPLGCAAFTWDGIFVGATASRGMRDAMILSLAAFAAVWFAGKALLPSASSGSPAIHLLMAAYFAHIIARALHLTARYRKDIAEK